MSDIEKISVNGTEYDINGERLAHKAEVDGAYEGMTVGNAEQLVSSVRVTDKTPYLFRTAGGNLDIGDRRYTTLVGADVAVNQLFDVSTFGAVVACTKSYSSSTGEVTITPTNYSSNSIGIYTTAAQFKSVANHVYFETVDIKPDNEGRFKIGLEGTGEAQATIDAGKYTTISKVVRATGALPFILYLTYLTGETHWVSGEYKYKNVQIIDLTQMFGTAIADSVLTKESATAGSGIAWLKSQGFDFRKYRANNAGTLSPTNPSAMNTYGFNQWDEQWEVGGLDTNGQKYTTNDRIRTKNYIPLVGGASYYRKSPNNIQVWYYDANYNTLGAHGWYKDSVMAMPDNARWAMFQVDPVYGTTYHNDICINLHYDGSRDGEYEQYKQNTYSLGNFPLHGVFKLVDGNIQAVGDTRDEGGNVGVNYGQVDLGTLNYNDASATTGLVTATSYLPNQKYYNNNWDTQPQTINSKGYTQRPYYTGNNDDVNSVDHSIGFVGSANGAVAIRDIALAGMTGAQVKAALSGVYLTYPLATPTTDTADPFTSPQVVDNWGTEEFVVDNDNPVGHVSEYPQNLRDKLESIPNPPNGDGDYIVRQTGGTGEYRAVSDNAIIQGILAKLPNAPTEDGTYKLTCTVTNGTAVYSWEAE